MLDDIRVMPNEPTVDPPKKETAVFQTPDEVAMHDQNADVVIDMSEEDEKPNQSMPKTKRKLWPPTKKQLIIAGLIVVMLIAGGVLAYFGLKGNKPVVAVNKTLIAVPNKPISDLVPSTLSGLPVNPSANNRPITAVMIENLPPARPQSGLSQAGVVFEALTEGGITRFMALFQDQLPTYVGPVRSVRPYFLDWAQGFDAPIAHDGGSVQALSQITAANIKNLDYLDNPNYYTRISSRPAPHNLYTSVAGLVNLEAAKGWTSSSFSGWPRKSDSPAKPPSVTSIDFNPSYSEYNVNYSYNSATNSYNRSEGGSPQIDANTGAQLSPKVVIGMIVPWSQGALDTSDAYYSVYQDVGSGQAYVFQDGSLTIGQWNKASPSAALTFTDSSGNPLQLNAGQTWITALASTSEASYN